MRHQTRLLDTEHNPAFSPAALHHILHNTSKHSHSLPSLWWTPPCTEGVCASNRLWIYWLDFRMLECIIKIYWFTVQWKLNEKTALTNEWIYNLYIIQTFVIIITFIEQVCFNLSRMTRFVSNTCFFFSALYSSKTPPPPKKKKLSSKVKDHVTPKTGVMMLKIQLCYQRNKLYFKIYIYIYIFKL